VCTLTDTLRVRLGGSVRRVCTGTPVHYELTVREEGAVSVCGYTCTPIHYAQTARTETVVSACG